MNEPTPTPDQRLLVMKVITVGLLGGVVAFAVTAAIIVWGFGREPFQEGQLISLIAAGFAVMMFVAHLVIPGVIAQSSRASADAPNREALYGVYQIKLIVALALLEGAAFFNLVALIIEHHWWSLAIAGGLLLCMLSLYPTRTRVEHWVESQHLT